MKDPGVELEGAHRANYLDGVHRRDGTQVTPADLRAMADKAREVVARTWPFPGVDAGDSSEVHMSASDAEQMLAGTDDGSSAAATPPPTVE